MLRLALLVSMVLCLATLIACGSDSTPTTPTPAPAPAPAPAPPPPPPPPPPTPSITITARLIAGGVGSATQEWAFTATSNVTFTSYDWGFGDGATSNDSRADEQHVYRRRGTFTVTVTGRRSGADPVVGTIDITI